VLPIVVLLGFVGGAIFAPLLVIHDPTAVSLDHALQPPFWQSGGSLAYPLGVDQLGRDIFSRVIYGTRISFIVAATVIGLGATVGTIVGLLSGYMGKWVDLVFMRLTDAQLSIPVIFLALTLVGVFGASLENIVIVIVITSWPRYARLIRSETLVLKEQPFVDLAMVAGCKDRRILLRHIFPNLVPSIIVMASLDVPRVILFEAALSFLGLGIQPPTPSWGGMISAGRAYMTTAWWVVIMPGIPLMIVSLACNLIGDWLRDTVDPTLQI
jgi:peptide/nickel transport system permease protein